jgi:thiamine-monophosphate kinase
MDERGRIALLAQVFASAGPRPRIEIGIEIGIGDDAAVLRLAPEGPAPPGRGGSRLVWTIDEQVEGTHFRRELLGWRDVGWRSFMSAASDVAAMAAEPWCALCALVLPASFTDEALEELARGQRAAAASIGAPVIGGNLARGPAVSIATTLLGRCDRPVTRAGARPGDTLWLAGAVGLAAAGLRALERGVQDPRLDAAVEAWRAPRALVGEGLAMAPVASAGVDVSDGLARDAGHLAEAGGVQLVLDAAALEADGALSDAATALGASALELALHGGEDYALLATASAAPPGFRCVGEVRSGHGLVLRTADGERPLDPGGFDHFAAPRSG